MPLYPPIEFPYTNVHQLNLDWVIERLKETIDIVNRIAPQVGQNTQDIAALKRQLAEMQLLLEKIQAGGFDELYLSAVQKWLDDNLPDMVRSLVKYVMFGLTLDGYFCAVIPEAWNFLTFDTIAIPTSDLYGHLILRW